MLQKRGKGFYTMIVLIVCLTAFGIGLILRTYNSYVEQFKDNQDAKQMQLAQAVDRTIESLLNQSRHSLEYIIGLEQFQAAEEKWIRNGEYGDILNLLTESHLIHNDLISDMIAMQDGKILLGVQGQETYEFLNDDRNSTQRICLCSNGNIYLAVICKGKDNTDYAGLIDLRCLYEKISSEELAVADQLILLDQNCSVLLHYCLDQGAVKNTLVENCPKRQDFQLILSAEKNQEQGSFPFVYQNQRMEKGYQAHLMVIPSEKGGNKSFAIGMINNIDAELIPLKYSSIRWLVGVMAVLFGISLLLMLVLYYRRRDVQGAKELEVLKEKNHAMEELNRKTQEMAHHQRLEMIGTLTSGIAHEFNNLLTPIMGYSMLALEQLRPDMEEIYDNVLEIYHSSCKAKEITAQLSQYSRKNQGEPKKVLQVRKLVERVLHVAKPVCPQGVEIRMVFHDNQAEMFGSETQISQLLLNLIINAFHAMAEEGGVLTISTGLEQETVSITLQDTGCGIPEKMLPNIFEPFFTTKESGKGSGLGLAIARQIAEDHNGDIKVVSREKEGSTFIVSFPVYCE